MCFRILIPFYAQRYTSLTTFNTLKAKAVVRTVVNKPVTSTEVRDGPRREYTENNHQLWKKGVK